MTKKRMIWLTASLVCGAALSILMPPCWAQATITFTPANPMHKARGFFVANELLNGNILVAGGYDGSLLGPPNFPDSEIYDWHTGLWTVTTPLNFMIQRREPSLSPARLQAHTLRQRWKRPPCFRTAQS